MTPELAHLTLKLLERVPLKGVEVPAFNAATEALKGLAAPKPRRKKELPKPIATVS